MAANGEPRQHRRFPAEYRRAFLRGMSRLRCNRGAKPTLNKFERRKRCGSHSEEVKVRVSVASPFMSPAILGKARAVGETFRNSPTVLLLWLRATLKMMALSSSETNTVSSLLLTFGF